MTEYRINEVIELENYSIDLSQLTKTELITLAEMCELIIALNRRDEE